MLKDVTLGQYFPGTTAIHRLDPRTKLVLVIVYIVALFLAKNVVSYALVFVFLAAVVMISRIQLKVLLRSMKPLLFIIILTGLLNLFYGSGEPIAKFWIFKITADRADRRSGKPAQPAEEAPCAGTRAFHDDVHRAALHSDASGGNGQDHVRPEGERRGF